MTRQIGALASGALTSLASSVLLLMILTRLVPKAQVGAYQQLSLIYGVVAPLLVAGIPAALLYFIPRSDDPANARAWVGDAYFLLGALGLTASVVVAIAHPWIADAVGNPALSPVLLVYAPYPFLASVSAVMPPALVAVHRAALVAKLGALGGLIQLVAVLAAVSVAPDARSMAAGLVASIACVALLNTCAVQGAIGISLDRKRVACGSLGLLRYGVPLALTGLVGMVAFQFDRLVVSRNFTPALFAVYTIGAAELPIAVILQQAVNSVLIPALGRHYAVGDIAGMIALWRHAIRRMSLVLFPVFIFFMLTAPATVQFLFGGGYRESAAIFRIYLLIVPIRVATYGLITQAIGRTRVNLAASFVLLGSNMVLVLALVGPLGLSGPALGSVIADIGMGFYYLVRLRGILGVTIRALFPSRILLTNLVLSALAGVPIALLIAAGLHGLIQLPVAAAIYAPCYFALMFLAGRLEPREIESGRRMLGNVLGALQRRLWARVTQSSP